MLRLCRGVLVPAALVGAAALIALALATAAPTGRTVVERQGRAAVELPVVFGGTGFSHDGACAKASQTHETASGHGCFERVVVTPTHLRAVVRAAPPPTYRLRLLGCTALGSCGAATAAVITAEAPAAGSPPSSMTRYTLLLPRTELSNATRVCARQDASPPVTGPSDAAALGCLPYAPGSAPAGAFRVRILKEGVVVDGWIIDPRSAKPVIVEARRGTAKVREVAKRSDRRSKARWPGFDSRHGFRLVLPFVGQGGAYQVCLVAPGHTFGASGHTAGCGGYSETASLFLGDSAYTVGDTVRFTAEMLDPGARVRFNLLTSVGAFLLPWRYSTFAATTADGRGHVTGEIPTRTVPPGEYRLALQCESGCSKIALWAPPRPDGYAPCCAIATTGTTIIPVALGPSFRLASRTNTRLSVQIKGDRRVVRVQASRLPPKANVRIVLVVGGERPPCVTCGDYRDNNVDGVVTLELAEGVTVDPSGRIRQLDLQTQPLQPGRYLLWVVRGSDTVHASTEFTVT